MYGEAGNVEKLWSIGTQYDQGSAIVQLMCNLSSQILEFHACLAVGVIAVMEISFAVHPPLNHILWQILHLIPGRHLFRFIGDGQKFDNAQCGYIQGSCIYSHHYRLRQTALIHKIDTTAAK